MHRRDFLKTVTGGAAVIAVEGLLGQAATTPAARPNIIFILADDLGYGDLGCYGQKLVATPNLDRMAAEGMRFTDAYCGAPVCAPSRCCLMTGQHTGHAWIRGNNGPPLRPRDVTVAQVLKSAGYATGLVGKWGLGDHDTFGIPNWKGFDYFFGFLNQSRAHNYYPEFLYRNRDEIRIEGNVVRNGVATARKHYAPDLFLEESLSFIDRNRSRPFFLHLTTTVPHANSAAREKGLEVPSDEPYSDRDWPQPRKNFAAMVTRMDRDIGRIMARLRELGIDDNTIVFFSSDNGPHREGGHDPAFFNSSGPLRGIKRDLYEGGIRVPLVVRWPGRIAPGSVSALPCAFWDFLPTAAELGGAAAPPGLDGMSILPALLGRTQKEHEFLYWEFHEGAFVQAVRMGRWKALRRGLRGRLELYDLSSDIGETTDIAARHPAEVARIEAYLKTARTDSEYWEVGA